MKAMNAKSICVLVFVSLGFIVFPLAFFSNLHLYGDGAYYFARLVVTERVSATGPSTRFFGNIITELPTLLALKSGVVGLKTLSRIYGGSLYYAPFLCYAAATYLLFRKNMPFHATLSVLMYTILVYLTSYFIISESHFSSSLFILTVSIVATCNMQSLRTLIALVCIGTIAFLSYEFWAIFFLCCIVLFLSKIRGQDTPPPLIKFVQRLIILIYIAGSITNISWIFFTKAVGNRNLMIEQIFNRNSHFIFAACVLFGSAILYGCFSSTFDHVFNRVRLNSLPKIPYLQYSEIIFILTLLATFFTSALLFFQKIPQPMSAYALRSLNLLLPLLFALVFITPQRTPEYTAQAQIIATWVVLPILFLTVQANLYQISRWLEFKGSLLAISQQQTGFISINDVNIRNPEFLWGWTTPTLSILVQAMNGSAVHSVLFNPKATWQPYGPSPSSCDEYAEVLAKSLHRDIFITTETNNSNNANYCK